MTDITTVAKAYIDTWNETEPRLRDALLAAHWMKDAAYADPLMSGRGQAEISTLIAGVHAQFPGFRFQLLGKPDRHGSNGRFRWGLGPEGMEPVIEGTDFVELNDGKLARITGFLDKVPA